MRKLVFVGILMFSVLSISIIGVEKPTIMPDKNSVLELYLDNLSNYSKITRENAGIITTQIGGGIFLGGVFISTKSSEYSKLLLGLGATYVSIGVLSGFQKSKQEIEYEGYLNQISIGELSIEEKEKLALTALENIVTAEKINQKMNGIILMGSGALLTRATQQLDSVGVGIGFIVAGAYTAFIMKTPNEVFLDKYKKLRTAEDSISLDVSTNPSISKISLSYNF